MDDDQIIMADAEALCAELNRVRRLLTEIEGLVAGALDPFPETDDE